MLVLLPIACWIALVSLFRAEHSPRRAPVEWPRVLAASCVAWGAALTLVSEALSALHLLRWEALAGAWLLLTLVVLLAHRPAGVRPAWPRPTLPRHAVVGAAVLLCSALLLVALAAPPNTWDTLTYHMPRVMHWLQNGSLRHYPTNILRQLWNAPWSEYAFLHLHALSGGDRFANLVQWFAMCGCLVLGGSIAGRLARSTWASHAAVLLIGTVPMGVLQASGTQNNYIVAFWLLCGVQALVGRDGDRTCTRGEVVLFAGAMALAVATKATAVFWVSGLMLWMLARCARSGWRPTLTAATAGLAAALVLCGPHWLRNYRLFGDPLSPQSYGIQNFKLTNDRMTPLLFASNLVRNLAMQLATNIPGANAALERGILSLHAAAGMRISEGPISSGDFELPRGDANEDTASSPLHTCVALAGFLAAPFRLRRVRARRLLALMLVTLAGAAFYVALLRWQVWTTRLHLPGMILALVCSAALLAPGDAQRWPARVAHWLAGAALFFFALPALFVSVNRPLLTSRSCLLIPRESQFFIMQPDSERGFRAACERIRSSAARRVGLELFVDDWEYVLWVLLAPSGRDLRLFHVGVDNESQRCEPEAEQPDVIVASDVRMQFHQESFGARGIEFISYGCVLIAELRPSESEASSGSARRD
ncbi:MAG: hypothetical protein CHACPFDD_00514 [Phycisphaerae bacterium]|nr:hypothetical protein [Phycisphaerae bacterium]